MNILKSLSIPVEAGPESPAQTFNRSWSVMKLMVLFFGVVVVITIVISALFVKSIYTDARDRVYVIAGEATLVAKSALNDLNAREIEVRGHVKLFMNNMYAFDERDFESNIERALHLIGEDGKLILAEYQKAKTHEQLIKSNGIVSISIDSIWTNMNQEPYKARVFCKQRFETSVQQMVSVIWADMYLRNAGARSEDNLAGLIIENFNIVKNEPFKE